MRTPNSPQDIRRALVVFTSHPREEAFRKHLAGRIDDHRRIYRAFLRHILNQAQLARRVQPFDIVIASDSDDLPNLEAVAADLGQLPYRFIAHQGERFGDRLTHALQRTLASGYEQVAIIGNDCLDISVDSFLRTFQQLDHCDHVVGPAEDGGFYLLGLKAFTPALFDGIAWRGKQVLAQLCNNIVHLDESLHLLTPLSDIDSADDLRAWLRAHEWRRYALIFVVLRAVLARKGPLYLDVKPFIPHSHLRKRAWQIPPPLALP